MTVLFARRASFAPIAAGAIALAYPASANGPMLELDGAPIQSGLVVGRTEPGVELFLNDRPVAVAPDGAFLIGFGRDAPPHATLIARGSEGESRAELDIAAREDYVVQKIDGLPPSEVTPLGEETLARIASERELIAAAKQTLSDETGWRTPILRPAEGPESGVFGSQRILNGEPRAWHRGVDIAGPEGAPIWAMADGIVILAEPDLFFTGGTVWLDHGLGLSSVYAHMSEIAVSTGQKVRQGETLGAIGSTGRSTGPHLHWGVYWRDVPIDPNLLASIE